MSAFFPLCRQYAICVLSILCLYSLSVSAQESVAIPDSPAPVAIVLAPSVPKQLTSLFFSDAELDSIAEAKQEYKERLQGPSETDLLDQLNGIKNAQKQSEILDETHYEQFYFESLIYHTASDWTLWIKNIKGSEKFTPEILSSSGSGLQLLAVSKESVILRWYPRNWNYIVKKFTDQNPKITLDKEKKSVSFPLSVNQTMNSYDMQISEGVVPAVQIIDATTGVPNAPKLEPQPEPENVPGKPATLLSPATPSPIVTPPAAPAPAAKQGAPILDQYKALETLDRKP